MVQKKTNKLTSTKLTQYLDPNPENILGDYLNIILINDISQKSTPEIFIEN
jgi:hypothetical protein